MYFGKGKPTASEIVTNAQVRVLHPDGSGTYWVFKIATYPEYAHLGGYYPATLTGSGSLPDADSLVFDSASQTYSGVMVPPAPSRILTLLSFSDRFSDAEFDAISDSADADVSRAWKKFQLAQDIDLDDPRTGGFLDLLEAKAVLAPGRKAEILA